jgi:hypothetical protein
VVPVDGGSGARLRCLSSHDEANEALVALAAEPQLLSGKSGRELLEDELQAVLDIGPREAMEQVRDCLKQSGKSPDLSRA